jgi:hypothetical protein
MYSRQYEENSDARKARRASRLKRRKEVKLEKLAVQDAAKDALKPQSEAAPRAEDEEVRSPGYGHEV